MVGHQTDAMQAHGSPPCEREQRMGLAKVIDLAGAREAHQTPTRRAAARGV